MDPVTHTLTGAALARGGLDRAGPLALPALVLAANAPDVDVLVYARGPYAALSFRRGLTHGLPALLVLPLVVAGLVLLWDARVRRRRRPEAPPARPGAILAASAAGVLSHPVLDWMNTYGMRWLVPFRDAWTYGDALFIVDPWLWLTLGGALFVTGARSGAGVGVWVGFWGLASVLVLSSPVPVAAKAGWGIGLAAIVSVRLALGSRDPRQGSEPPRRRRLVAGAGAVAVVYVGAMVGADLAAAADVRAAARDAGIDGVSAVMVAPRPADPFSGDVVVRSGDGYVRGRHRWLGAPRVELDLERALSLRYGPGLDAGTVERAVVGARRDRRVRDFLVWSRFPRWRVARTPDGGYEVRLSDIRYEGAGSLGGLVMELDAGFRPVTARNGAGGDPARRSRPESQQRGGAT